MLKEQLIEEAQNIDASVELDSVFESVELSDDVKENFSTVFEAAVKKNAVKLAESHIQAIAESADQKVEEAVSEKTAAIEATLREETQKYLEHLGSEWIAENKVAIRNDIRSSLFESLLSGMKELFIENNVVVPEESVDVVAEMEAEAMENKQQANKMFEENVELKSVILGMKRKDAIREATVELTESQVEKVTGLTEGMKYDNAFEGKLGAIVEMVKGYGAKQELKENSVINTEEENPNFEPIQEVAKDPEDKPDAYMNAYMNQI